jgi:hypothetical protein
MKRWSLSASSPEIRDRGRHRRIENVGDERLMVGVRESHGIGPRTTTGGAIAGLKHPLE